MLDTGLCCREIGPTPRTLLFSSRLTDVKALASVTSLRTIWLQVYEAFFLMATRDFKAAANLFLEAIATFTTCVSLLDC